jgi:DNA (cytosine-5)-methyltransferase 1
MKIFNGYAGVGGNRKLWGSEHEIVAVENHPDIAEVYASLYPNDTVIVGDAHQYLLDHFADFDFIWTSPPCQTHSKMNKATRHKTVRYADMSLYQEIILLQHFFKGKYVVENVSPYYEPLIAPRKMGRHSFWTNIEFQDFDVARPQGFINQSSLEGKKILMDWLGIHFEKNIYYGSNHCPAQILRNCVHPLIGEHILNSAMNVHPNAHGDLFA